MPIGTAQYRLKAGKKHFHEGRSLEAGEVITLTDGQARHFHDKFELVSGTAPTPPAPPPLTPVKTSGGRIEELQEPAGTSGKAQDAGAKTPVGKEASNVNAASGAEVTTGEPPAAKK